MNENITALPDAPEPTPDPRRWKALGVLAAGLAMIVLDGTIVGIALPAIIGDLQLSISESVWVNSLYSVVVAALLLASGRLSDRIGRRTSFLIGIAVFMAGSVLAGVASASGPLIAARFVQGLGGALIMPTTVSTVNVLFRGRERAHAFGIWGAVMSASAAIGPLAGGALTQFASWRWVFFVNVPVGAIVLVLGLMWVPQNRGDETVKLDALGVLLSALGFGLLTFGLIEGNNVGWWTPMADFPIGPVVWLASAPISAIPVAILLAIVLLIGFVAWEKHRAAVGRSPLLDLSLFQIGAFAWGNLTAFTVSAGEFALIFVMPLFLINVLSMDVMAAGWVLAAMAIGAFLSGASARHLAQRFGSPTTVIIGLALEVLGTALTALVIGISTPPVLIAATMVVYGLGLGLASAQLTSTVMLGVPTRLSGVASATQSTLRQVGSALGAALSGTMLAVGLGVRLPVRLAEVPGLPADVPGVVIPGVMETVGGLIPVLRNGKGFNTLGDLRIPVGDALARGFADATTWSVWLSCGFLCLGLIGSLVVRSKASEAVAE